MAKLITATQLDSGSNNGNFTSYNSNAITPSPKSLILAAVSSVTGSSVNIPTCSGAGMAWVEIAHRLSGDTQNQLTLFRGMSTSPGSGALTFNFAGQSQTRANWVITQFNNTKTDTNNGAVAIVQTATNAVGLGANTGLTVTLGAFKNSNNATYGVVRQNNNLLGNAPGSNFTELAVQNINSQYIEAEWANNNQTSVNWTWNSTATYGIGIAVEIAIATQGGGFLFNFI